jgi:DNA invertase Pin-like site-specific DNA recombinase
MSKKRYREKVTRITKYNTLDMVIPEGYTVDHIFPVSFGYNMGVPEELISDVRNLQIMSLKENIKKNDTTDSIPLFIQEYLLGLVKINKEQSANERRLNGIKRRKENGGYNGRVKGSIETPEQFLNKPKIKQAVELLNKGNLSLLEISKEVGIHFNTMTKIKKIING